MRTIDADKLIDMLYDKYKNETGDKRTVYSDCIDLVANQPNVDGLFPSEELIETAEAHMVRADRYYDVGCDFCGKHLSTDYQTGLFDTRKQAEARAKQIGFKTKDKRNICPECLACLHYSAEELKEAGIQKKIKAAIDAIEKPERPACLPAGEWNQTIFGKRVYRVYVDDRRINITKEQKEEIESWLKAEDEYKKEKARIEEEIRAAEN